LALNLHSLRLKGNQSREDAMVQYLELVLKRELTSGWRHTVEKVGMLFEKSSEVGSKEMTEKLDWEEKAGKNWYY
jgi:hypothetical protein